MSFNPSGGFASVSTTPQVVRTPEIANLSLPDTAEYFYVVPTGTKLVSFRTRTPTDVKVAYAAGETATNYLTIPLGQSYNSLGQGIILDVTTTLTLYVAASRATVLEIELWS